MSMTLRRLASTLILALACASRAPAVPLIVTPTGEGRYRPEVDLLVDGHRVRAELDTGARTTSLIRDPQLARYAVWQRVATGGAFGPGASVDLIRPHRLSAGSELFLDPYVLRPSTGAHSLLGIDLLGLRPFQVDFRNASLHFPSGLLQTACLPLRVLHTKHAVVPVRIGEKAMEALFDTGAEVTLVDLAVARANPRTFELARSEEGTDSTGHRSVTPIYRIRSLAVGPLELEGVEAAAVP